MWLTAVLQDPPDWDTIEATFAYAPAMRACIQDPVYHGEGDVWTHTKLVAAQLGATYLGDDPAGRLTALFHDVAKPQTRDAVYEAAQGRVVVHHPHHARLGAQAAWHDLWRREVALPLRLEVHWLCLWHQKVFHMWTQSDMARKAREFAVLGSWRKLLAFARADNAGRVCPDPAAARDNLDLLEEWLDEQHLLGTDAADWTDPDSQRFYFERTGRSPLHVAQAPAGSRVIVLSGLPGCGKSHYTRTRLSDYAVISLDRLRATLDVKPNANQGRVIQAAYAEARAHLRAHRPFVWNATCVTRQMRAQIIGLCRAYDAHVSIHAFDRPPATIARQNAQRADPVPTEVIDVLAAKWEPPSRLEAHAVVWV